MISYKHKFLLIGILIISQITNAQELVTRNLSGFHAVSVMGKMRVELYKSDTSRVEFTVSNVPSDNLITEVTDSVLSIRLKTDTNKSSIFKVLVYYSNLDEITVASNTLLVSPQIITGENIKFTARSGAKMELELNLKNLVADVKQGGILVFTGSVKVQKITVNTGATYSAYKLTAEDSYVVANAGSKAKVCASRIIDVSSNTKSYVGYIGIPVSVISKTNLGGVIASFATEEDVFDE